MKSFPTTLIRSLALAALIGLARSTVRASTSSYTTDVVPPGDYDLLSWSFQPEDLSHLFNPYDQTIEILLYSNGTYYVSS